MQPFKLSLGRFDVDLGQDLLAFKSGCSLQRNQSQPPHKDKHKSGGAGGHRSLPSLQKPPPKPKPPQKLEKSLSPSQAISPRTKNLALSSNNTAVLPQNCTEVIPCSFAERVVIASNFDDNKLIFLSRVVDVLRHASLICFSSGFYQGAVECLNHIIRACCSTNDLQILRQAYRLLSSIYLQMNEHAHCLNSLQREHEIALDAEDWQDLVRIEDKVLLCHNMMQNEQQALQSGQAMLQYAWQAKSTAGEIQAYNNLSVVYFNLGDLRNSKFYSDKALNMILEPEESRVRLMACDELAKKVSANSAGKLVDFCVTQSVDWKGKPCTRLQRLLTTYDSNGKSIQTTIESYGDATSLRELAERFISQKLAVDLANYERLNLRQVLLPPARFQNEAFMSSMNIEADDREVADWPWGKFFIRPQATSSMLASVRAEPSLAKR